MKNPTMFIELEELVTRAERMGLAISLVSTLTPEKVWYHGQWCSSRGKKLLQHSPHG